MVAMGNCSVHVSKMVCGLPMSLRVLLKFFKLHSVLDIQRNLDTKYNLHMLLKGDIRRKFNFSLFPHY